MHRRCHICETPTFELLETKPGRYGLNEARYGCPSCDSRLTILTPVGQMVWWVITIGSIAMLGAMLATPFDHREYVIVAWLAMTIYMAVTSAQMWRTNRRNPLVR